MKAVNFQVIFPSQELQITSLEYAKHKTKKDLRGDYDVFSLANKILSFPSRLELIFLRYLELLYDTVFHHH